MDVTSLIPDETLLLKLLSSLSDASAAHAQHVAEELLRQLKVVRVSPVLRFEQPACQALI